MRDPLVQSRFWRVAKEVWSELNKTTSKEKEERPQPEQPVTKAACMEAKTVGWCQGKFRKN